MFGRQLAEGDFADHVVALHAGVLLAYLLEAQDAPDVGGPVADVDFGVMSVV